MKTKKTKLMPAAPTAAGYTFVAWHTHPTERTAATRWGASSTVSGDMTLYAEWSPTVYTMSFNTMGRGTAPPSQRVAFGSQAVRPADPVEQGYTFRGWFVDMDFREMWYFGHPAEDGSPAVPGDPMPARNLTLYALWETAEFTVTYDLNGHGYYHTVENDNHVVGGVPSPQRVSFSLRLPYNSLIPRFDNDVTNNVPVRTFDDPREPGYTFLGWFADPHAVPPVPWNFNTMRVPLSGERDEHGEDESNGTANRVWTIAVGALGIAAIVLLFATQRFRGIPALFDIWTILHALLLAAQIVAMRRKN